MTSATLIATIGAALILIGIFVAILGFLPPEERQVRAKAARRPMKVKQATLVRAGIGAGVGLVIALVSGWVVLIAVGPAAFVALPYLFSNGSQDDIKTLDAIDEWTRTLAGVLGAGNSLEDGIINTASSIPAAIKPQVSNLIARLRSRMSTENALRLFADELSDTTCDKIVCTLLLGAQRRSVGLAPILYDLADSVAEDVAARRMVLAERMKQTQTSRLVTLITAVIFGGFLLLGGSYAAPYGTPVGQLILVLLICAYVADLFWLKRSSRSRPLPRILGPQKGAL